MVVQTRTFGTQSIYRESEAQTDPYSPEVQIIDGSNPEVLTIAHLCAAKGLPVSETEVSTIERMRQKRLMEAKLPPPTDEFCLKIREKLVDAQEFEEWKAREELIKTLQAKRLELVKAALLEREQHKEQISQLKIERVRALCLEIRDKALDESHQRRLKVVRQTNRNRQKLERFLYPPDKTLVHQHYDTSSKLYGPYARHGHVPDTRTAKIDIQPLDLQNYTSVVALERSLPSSVLKVVLPSKEPSIKTAPAAVVRQYNRIGQALQNTLNLLKQEEEGFESTADGMMSTTVGGSTHMNLMSTNNNNATMISDLNASHPQMDEFSKRKSTAHHLQQETDQNAGVNQESTQNNVHAATLVGAGGVRVGAEALQEDEAEAQAILLLQRIVRGRARQNAMHAGKEKRLALIEELRAADSLKKTMKSMSDESAKEDADAAQDPESMQAMLEMTHSNAANAVLEAVGGKIIAEALDSLSKELRRFEEARRIAAIAKLAERERRSRQAGEAGRRQAEEIIRAREDEVFRQVMGSHHATVDSYLEDVITSTVHRKARAEALLEAKSRVDVINKMVDELEETSVDPHTVIRELVGSFLLPHIKREDVKRRVQREQERFAIAAKTAAMDALKTSINQVDQKEEEETTNAK